MEDKKPNVIIVGSGHDAGLLAQKIAELKLANPDCEVVTVEEARERGKIIHKQKIQIQN